jgi:hypothetical protein
MAKWHLACSTILTGRNLLKILHAQDTAPSIINEKTVADFKRVIEATGILEIRPKAWRPFRPPASEAAGDRPRPGRAARGRVSRRHPGQPLTTERPETS